MKTILITGGAGYIGSAIVNELCKKNYNIIVIDNLDKGKIEYVNQKAKFFNIDIKNKNKLDSFFNSQKINIVIHCAALKAVGESEQCPNKYFNNNIIGTINLLDCINKYKVEKILFSSTACVYKKNDTGIYSETDKIKAPNIYGFTKITCENLIKEQARLSNLKYIIFRYFNVSGDIGLNYIDPNAQNIFPIIAEVINKQREKLLVFGNDYKTKDGTGVRDYIHLKDLVDAHIKAIKYNNCETFNLGTSKGTSVLELINEFNKHNNVKYEITSRRAGDVPFALANPNKAKTLLNWEAKYTIKEMVESTLIANKTN